MSLEKYLEAIEKGTTFTDIVESVEQLDEAGTAHPLPGHDYHKKTDAELHFIAKDAKEAEDAMSGHNPKAANKYADQKNDAVTILHFRKKGMPDWYKKKYGHIKEETEIDEAAKDLPTWKLRSLVKNEIGGKENAEELARRQKEKKAGTYKSHSSDDAQAGVKDAKNFREETEIVEDNSALDAMDAKEKRKDKIRKYVKNQSPVKIKRTPGKSEVKEEVELDEVSHEKDLDHKKKIVVKGVKGAKSLPFTKKFRNMDAYDKWLDSDEAGDYDVRQVMNEDFEDLDEAVKIEHDRVIRVHGKKNTHTGHALWMFTNKRTGDVDYDNEKECHQVSATRKDAQNSAKEWAKKHGHSTVYFMESVEEINELSNKTLDSYRKKAKEDISKKIKSGDFDGVIKRDKGITQSYVSQSKKIQKEDLELDESGDYDINKVLDTHKDLSKHKLEHLQTLHTNVKNSTRLLGDGVKKATLQHISKEIQKRREAGEKAKGHVITTHPDGTRSHKVLESIDENIINEELDKHLKTLTDTLTAKSKAGSAEGLHTEFSVQTGKKYHKIIGKMKGASGGHVHAFVDKETGDVYKPAGYNAPAKGARYNLHKDIDHLAKHADQYGSYLYKR